MKNLKKIVPVVLICSLCVFMLTGCFNPFSLFSGNKVSKADAEAMKGTWELVAVTTDGKTVPATDVGVSMTFVFSDDGKVAYTFNGKSENLPWEKDGSIITIYDSENKKTANSYTAVLSDNYFTLHMDDTGKSMDMICAKKGTTAADPSKYVTQNTTATTPNTTTPNTTTPNTTTNNSNTQTQTTTPQQNTQTQSKEPVSLLGEWHLVAHIYGTRREQCEAVETANIYYTFYESGEYNLRNFNADEDGMYKRQGNSLTLNSDNGYSSLLGGLDGDELTVYDPATNINYVYKKN